MVYRTCDASIPTDGTHEDQRSAHTRTTAEGVTARHPSLCANHKPSNQNPTGTRKTETGLKEG